MIEGHWIKNLAKASLKSDRWNLENPEDSLMEAKAELNATVVHLIRDLEEAVHLFNLYHSGQQSMKLLPLIPPEHQMPVGLILLIAKAEVILKQEGHNLCQLGSVVVDFQKHEVIKRDFKPVFDSFGGLSWQVGQKSIMTRDQVAKQLLQDLWRLAQKAKGT